ncbi:site-specific integrase [Streptomyces sp. BRB081]|uniref:tyrosine-type recombinase/integrase n=1 Tax=Streptomyces sp. BRB081 TaxID=2769544 RepID=UPI0018ACC386|nr:site-specific integrase [Streptomyces sp. BRB081]MBL3805910.1 site-specific integrase [Streptomyces sp. BRB081]
MNSNLASITLIPSLPADDDGRLEQWRTFLAGKIDPAWREDEWDSTSWLFTGDLDNPRTAAYRCRTPECLSVLPSPHSRCQFCRAALRDSGLDEADFDASYSRDPQRYLVYTRPSQCIAGINGDRCRRSAASRGLCRSHHARWHRVFRRDGLANTDENLLEWAAGVPGLDPAPSCIVGGCPLDGVVSSGLCGTHYERWKKTMSQSPEPVPAESWALTAVPYLTGAQFSLGGLSPVMRLEMLLGLQQRDAIAGRVVPRVMRSLATRLTGFSSLILSATEAEVMQAIEGQTNGRYFCGQTLRYLRVAFDEFNGIDPTQRPVWDVAALGIAAATKHGRRRSGTIDFTQIRQPWLREVTMEWARSTRPTAHRLSVRLTACTQASRALSVRPGEGMTPSALKFADMTAVADYFSTLNRADGTEYTNKYRSSLLTGFWQVLEFGRQAGLMDDVPGVFTRHRSHRILEEDPNEDDIGKAIPESVIRQLDQNSDKLADTTTYGALEPADIKKLFRTIYMLLRDTGRRPREIASLKVDCLEHVDGDYNLIWDNHKGKRLRRRLPIDSGTVKTVQDWLEVRKRMPRSEHGGRYLFPAPTDRSAEKYIPTLAISRVIRQWADAIEHLDSEAPDKDGTPLPFDRSLIYPYAFRHSYAQRHADAGTPLDVLKELMDHRDASTTMGYYKVSLKRKRQAVKTMRLHVVDRSGRPAPMASNVSYERRSVAVPFGGCVEPSNVKAGGHACPIRFQCAGCGFYRPDPSYLPAIEDHIRSLKADRETAEAMDAEEWVVRNMAEVASFKDVAERMKEQMDKLEPAERAEIEEASRILRKTRATNGRTTLPVTVIQRQERGA